MKVYDQIFELIIYPPPFLTRSYKNHDSLSTRTNKLQEKNVVGRHNMRPAVVKSIYFNMMYTDRINCLSRLNETIKSVMNLWHFVNLIC
mmetsp:Transcript_19946/g.29314  ORF Transcript_19946/g.29314 Transcript_19946/m.29314 type:complete len:89 (+) Transcript_19946:93-359(+)